VAVDDTVYFGATDGRLFAVDVESGDVRWAYRTGGRINSSPSLFGNRVCISTYAGSIFCLDRRDGSKLWSQYFKRDYFRYESFYASPSTDGRRIFCVARSGKVYALDARTGERLWTGRVGSLGYTTPAISAGRVFVGGFDGALRAYSAATGRELWRRTVPGRILGAPVVVGDLVFFSTLETNTYAARVDTGKVVWRIGMGKYSPGIATDQHYYFSLNGLLLAFRAANSPPES
jgi:outer membrane protein assembly factor BamB